MGLGSVTVTEQEAVLFPSCVVHEIVADPAALAVTVPSEATEATDVLLEVHETAVFVALLGETVGVRRYVSPAVNDNDVGETETPVTATVALVTVTVQVAVLPPSSVRTVIVAEPAAFAVTTPLEETVATEVLFDDQVTPWLLAFEGLIVAFSDPVEPTTRPMEVLSRDTLETDTVAALTETEHVAFFAPSDVVQVIVADPAALAVTVPSDPTVATDVLLEVHVTLVLVALLGETVGVRRYVSPAVNDNDVGETETPVTATVAFVTVTVQVAVLPPSSVRTVIVAEPAAFAVTTPLDETVATVVLLDDHVTALLVALDGDTVAVRVPVVPAIKDILVLFRETPVTGTVPALTVTEHVAVLPPSDVVHVIVADPADLAVTVPSEETVATEVLLDDHVTALLVALLGETVGVSSYVSPAVNDNDVGDMATPVTETVEDFTVTVQVAVLLPSEVLTVTTVEPTFLAVTTPLELTVAMDVFADDQVTPLSVASEGETVATNVAVLPTCKVNEEGFRDTPVTETVEAFTVTEQVAVLPPSAVLAVIVAVPALLAVTSPSEDTVATEVLFDDHVTSLLDALEGLTVVVNHVVSPTVMERLEGERVTPVTETAFTVTEQEAVLLPSAVVTVILAVPILFAVTVPSEATVATSGLFDVQVTSLLVAFEGLTVAVS